MFADTRVEDRRERMARKAVFMVPPLEEDHSKSKKRVFAGVRTR
jgi:hypothetical protein